MKRLLGGIVSIAAIVGTTAVRADAQNYDWLLRYRLPNMTDQRLGPGAVLDTAGNMVVFGASDAPDNFRRLFTTRVSPSGTVVSNSFYVSPIKFTFPNPAAIALTPGGSNEAVVLGSERRGINTYLLCLRFPAGTAKPRVTEITDSFTDGGQTFPLDPSPVGLAVDKGEAAYILANEQISTINVSSHRILVARTSRSGAVLWKAYPKRNDAAANDEVYGRKILIDPATSNVLVLAKTRLNNEEYLSVFALKPTDGTTIWQTHFRDTGDISPVDFAATSDGFLYVIGSQKNRNNWGDSLQTLKLYRKTGTVDWFQEYYDTARSALYPKSIAVGADNDAYLFQVTSFSSLGERLVLHRLDSAGGQRYRTLLGSASGYDFAKVFAAPLTDGSLYAAYQQVLGDPDVFNVSRLGTSGEVQFRGDAVSPGFRPGAVAGLVLLPDGSAMAAGVGSSGSGSTSQPELVFGRYGSTAPALGLKVSPGNIFGSTSATGTITLKSPAPAAGLRVNLSKDSTKMTMPSSLTIPAGQTSATFLIRTIAAKNTERATIKATSAVGNAQIGVTISAPNIASFTVPSTVYEGVAGIATVTLDNAPVGQDAIVTVTTNSDLVQVPEFVVVPKGKKTVTFPVSAVALPEAYWPWVRVNIDESIKLSRFAVSQAIIREIVLPASTLGGLSVPGVIKLHGKPSANMTVSFATASAALTAPANVTIPSGASEGTFTLATKPVFTSTFATLSATARGTSVPAGITVKPTTLAGLTLNPMSVVGGKTSTGTVTLASPAPAGGTPVSLQSASANAECPVSIVVPAGKTTATFTILTKVVSKNSLAGIYAKLGTVTKSQILTITK